MTSVDKKATSKTVLNSLKGVLSMSELEYLFQQIEKGIATVKLGEDGKSVIITRDYSKEVPTSPQFEMQLEG